MRLLFWHWESPKVIVENVGEGRIWPEIFVVFDGADIVKDKSTEDWVEIADYGDKGKKKDGVREERGRGLVERCFPLQHYSSPDPSLWSGGSSSLKLEIQVHGSLARGAFPYFLTRARASGGRFRAVCEIPPAFRKLYFTKIFTHFYSIIVIYYIAYFQWWTWHFIKINFFGLVCWDK